VFFTVLTRYFLYVYQWRNTKGHLRIYADMMRFLGVGYRVLGLACSYLYGLATEYGSKLHRHKHL